MEGEPPMITELLARGLLDDFGGVRAHACKLHPFLLADVLVAVTTPMPLPLLLLWRLLQGYGVHGKDVVDSKTAVLRLTQRIGATVIRRHLDSLRGARHVFAVKIASLHTEVV